MPTKIYFYILIRSRKSFAYFDKCLDSVLSQTYQNFKILFIDDASGYTQKQKTHIRNKLIKHVVVINKTRRYSLFNAYYMINKYATNNDAVILNLDGDDWLYNSKVLEYIANVYNLSGCLLTYGECVFWDGEKCSKPSRLVKKYTNIPYPSEVVKKSMYRKYPFLPLHPRTWKVSLFKKISKNEFLRQDGGFFQFAEDQAIFYPMLEMARGKYQVIKKPLYVYNIETKESDVKKNLSGLIKDQITIRKRLHHLS